jgi:hypothetical protein
MTELPTGTMTFYQLVIPGLPSDFPPLDTIDVAFRRGVRRAAAVSAAILAVVSALALIAVNPARLARQATAREARQRQLLQQQLYAAHLRLAQQDWEEGNVLGALRLLGAVEALREALGLSSGATWWWRLRERMGEAVRAASLEQEFAAARAEGRAMSLGQAVEGALLNACHYPKTAE